MLEITAMDEFLDDVKSYNTIKDLLLYKMIMLYYYKNTDVK